MMGRAYSAPWAFAFLFSCVLIGCSQPETSNNNQNNNNKHEVTPAVQFSSLELQRIYNLSPLPERPPPNPTNKWIGNAKALHLGQYLFFDKRFSINGKLSCASCHLPTRGWVDGRETVVGIVPGSRNVTTLWNAAYNRWTGWDGKFDSIWSMPSVTYERPTAFGSSRLRAIHQFAADPKLRAAYESIFGPFPDVSDTKRFPKEGMPMPWDTSHPHHKAWESMTQDDQKTVTQFFTNILKTYEVFVREIISRDSPFDRFVEGLKQKDPEKLKAITESAQRGLKLFVGKAGCVNCHDGPTFSDHEFHNIGLGRKKGLEPDTGRYAAIDSVLGNVFNGLGPWSDTTPDNPFNDKLRYLKKANPNQLGEMKTMTLRNIAETAPYMHDGRFWTLKEVLQHYSKLEDQPAVGHREETMQKLNLTDDEINDLVEFLKSLTGKPLSPTLQKQPTNPTP